MVIRPNGYAIWERIVAEMDGPHQGDRCPELLLPGLHPLDYFEREKEHVEGFSPETGRS